MIDGHRGNRQTVTMVGTSPAAQGGVAAVVRALTSSVLSNRYVIDYVETHAEGGTLLKLAIAVKAWVTLQFRLLTSVGGLVHVHIASRASFWRKCFLLLPALAMRKPVLLHLHGGEFKVFYERESSTLAKHVIRYVFEAAAGVIVLSTGWKQWVERSFPRSKVRVIYNPAPDVARSAYVREPATLLFLGKLGEKKGVNDLLRAVAMLVPEFGEIRLLLGGDGDVMGANQLARKLEIVEYVEFLGWVSGQRKQELLEQCAAFVLPSYNEGLPMGLLEAMAYGMPVVTTPVGGIPEAVTDGMEGFLVEPGDIDALADRLARLLRDEALRSEMGTAGARKVSSTFAMERIIPQWVALYSEHGIAPAGDPGKANG
ncbi:glycosyltransferase involved in cell wall biosynthesis [Lysobacter niabensis]|uniref:Glycosyltransferase involved in cell wall biosynthesis n=1 Tax=Agrilutibacter niabensis TaxID=380628 RepID=A0ABU1VLF0_9GAMM|nr:glycosyltransferase family 4 protein [Lysobacter niabensis]MDR7098305.1 glycosyltransferase involved in cell wall biosynthesis [Lysobacter niabensis]